MTYYRLSRLFADADRNVVSETQSIKTCCGFVAKGAGVVLVGPFMAAHDEGKGLVTRRFAKASFRFSIADPRTRNFSPPKRENWRHKLKSRL